MDRIPTIAMNATIFTDPKPITCKSKSKIKQRKINAFVIQVLEIQLIRNDRKIIEESSQEQ